MGIVALIINMLRIYGLIRIASECFIDINLLSYVGSPFIMVKCLDISLKMIEPYTSDSCISIFMLEI